MLERRASDASERVVCLLGSQQVRVVRRSLLLACLCSSIYMYLFIALAFLILLASCLVRVLK